MNTRTSWTDATSFNSMFYTKEETIQSVKDNFDFRRYCSAEGKSILIDKTYTEQILVQQHSNPLNEDKTDRKIHVSMDSQLKYGSYVTYENSLWLVFSQLKNVDDAYKSAQIRQCNYTLNFQNGTTTVLQEPCIVTDLKRANIGEDKGTTITVYSTQKVIYLQYNINTSKLVEGKRIYIDQLTEKPKVYKITDINRIEFIDGNNGLWKLVCDEDQNQQDNDRPDLLIANYISTDPLPTPTPLSSGTSYITDTKGNIYTTIKKIKVGGLAVPFDCVFKDTSGNVVQNISPKWALIVSDDLKGKVRLTYSNSYPNRVYIQVLEGNENIGKQFNLTLEDANSLFGKCTLIIQVVS